MFSMNLLKDQRIVSRKQIILSFRYLSTALPSADIKKSSVLKVKKKSKKDSFFKSLFRAKYDAGFLVFPEILTKEEVNVINNTVSCFKGEHNEENDRRSEGRITDKFKDLLKSGVLQLDFPSEFGDNTKSITHFVKTVETLDLNASMSLFSEIHSLVAHIIFRNGSSEQKEKYLNKLLKGEFIGSYALSESEDDCDPSLITTSARLDDNMKNYIINGEKKWVLNGKNSDVMIVFAKIQDITVMNSIAVGVFIVDTKTQGISFFEQNIEGLTDCNVCNVKFDNVLTPVDNVLGIPNLGYDVVLYDVKFPKYFINSCILHNLKKIFHDCNIFIRQQKHSVCDLKDREYIQVKVAKVAAALYSFESMIYWISGFMDQYDMDSSLELALIKVFGYEKCMECFKLCLEILGGKSYDNNYSYGKLFKETYGLTLTDKNIDVIKQFVAFSGLEHAGQALSEDVKRMRNPLNFPSFVFRKILSHNRNQNDNPLLKMNLFENLHPSLKSQANQLEYCVSRFHFALETLLVRHGTAITNRQFEVISLCDVCIEILSMTSSISRVSHSYCTGIKDCDDEVMLVRGICSEGQKKVRQIVNSLVEGNVLINDFAFLNIGSKCIEKGHYYFDHPTSRNIS